VIYKTWEVPLPSSAGLVPEDEVAHLPVTGGS